MECHPCFQKLLGSLHVVRHRFAMREYGGQSEKPTWLYSSAPFSQKQSFDLRCLLEGAPNICSCTKSCTTLGVENPCDGGRFLRESSEWSSKEINLGSIITDIPAKTKALVFVYFVKHHWCPTFVDLLTSK